MSPSGSSQAAVAFVGPALGGHPGWVTTQGEVLAGHFAVEGLPVKVTSTQIPRARRAADTVSCLVRWRRQVDVAVVSVFSGGAFVMADLTTRTTRALHIPTVLWLHGGNLPELFREQPERARRVLSRAAVIVAPSTYLARAAGDLGFDVEIIDNVVDLGATEFRLRTHLEPRLLWMRTFHELYNPVLAVEVLARVRERFPAATLTMAGQEKGFLTETLDAVRLHHLDDAITFPGFLGPGDKPTVFAQHDLFLNTNRVDNTPVSVIEAAAFGLPIVSTDVGGLSHLLEDGVTALLVPDDDAPRMADAAICVLEDDELAARLSKAGRVLAERSDWAPVRDRWQDVFARVRAGS